MARIKRLDSNFYEFILLLKIFNLKHVILIEEF